MAFGGNLRIVPVLGLAVAGGLSIGFASAFTQNRAPASDADAAQVASGQDPIAPKAEESVRVKWVIREQAPKAEERISQRVAQVGQSGSVRRRSSPAGVYYSGCREARAAGVAPIYAGEPGYRPEMDGDGDGIACEPYRGR